MFIFVPQALPIYFPIKYSVCHQTHYETLGLDRNATQKQIKEAYIKMGKEVSTANTYCR